jgi:hypothetical protein
MPALVEPLRINLAALTAPLGRFERAGWSFSHDRTSVFSFVSKQREKLSRSPLQDGLVEAGLCRSTIGQPCTRLVAGLGFWTLRQVFDPKLFREDGARLSDQSSAQFVLPVFALARHLAMQLGDVAIQMFPSPRQGLFGVTRLIQRLQLGFVATQPTRIVDLLKGPIITLNRDEVLDTPLTSSPR